MTYVLILCSMFVGQDLYYQRAMDMKAEAELALEAANEKHADMLQSYNVADDIGPEILTAEDDAASTDYEDCTGNPNYVNGETCPEIFEGAGVLKLAYAINMTAATIFRAQGSGAKNNAFDAFVEGNKGINSRDYNYAYVKYTEARNLYNEYGSKSDQAKSACDDGITVGNSAVRNYENIVDHHPN